MGQTVKFDVFKNTELIKDDDCQFLIENSAAFEKRFATRGLFRSETEMVVGVLNDSEHPTADSKYWQAIGEQNVHVTELINLSYEAKKNDAKNDLLIAEIEELQDELSRSEGFKAKKLAAQIKHKEIELEQDKFGQTQSKKVAQERLREIKTWEEIILELEKHLEFGNEDFTLHHAKRYYLRYQNKMENLALVDNKESVVAQFKGFEKLFGITNQQALPNAEQATIQAPSIERVAEVDPIAAKYISRKTKKILIGAPHRTNKCGNVTNFNSLQVPAGWSCKIEEPFGYPVAEAQNIIVQRAIDEGFEYIFFVEDDNLIPRNALVTLMKHQAEVVGGMYYRKYLPLETAGMHYDKDGCPTSIDYKIGDIIHDTLVLPMGCTLIKTEVFEKMEKPWFKSIEVNNRPVITSDTYISQKIRDLGFDVITDTNIQSLHIDKNKGVFYGHPNIVDYEKNEITPEWREYFAV